jgi:hypothetical protein
MTASEDGFVSRWSQRKRQARVADPKDQDETPLQEPTGQGEPEPAPDSAAPDEAAAADLPDPDTLNADSDFTVYLKDGVPEALRRRALRRLWRSNPLLANVDGLNDYDLDYTDKATVVAGLKTLYQVGRGFVVDEDKDKDKDEDAEAPSDSAESVADHAGTPASEGEQSALETSSDRHQEKVISQPGNEESSGTARNLADAEGSAVANAGGKSKSPAGETVAASKGLPGDALRRRWGVT